MKEDLIKIFTDKVKQAKSIAISGHKNPDGDSLCSALALAKIIEINFGKSVTVMYDGNIPKDLEEVPLRKRAKFYGHVPEDSEFDLYILVDYGTKSHIGGVEKFLSKSEFIIEFDHHINPEPIGDLCFDDENKASASQVIYRFIRDAKLKTNREIIDLLTLAMITDTGNFKFVRHSDVFKDAADLVDAGANMSYLYNLLQNKDKKTVLMESSVISKAQFLMRGRLAIAIIDKNDYKKLDGRGEFVLSSLSKIHGVEFVALLKEQKENQIGISLRSKNTPINHIAESLGGGGHLCAAGAVIMDSLENVREKIVKAFKGM